MKLSNEQIKTVLKRYSFTPNDKEVEAISEVLEGTDLTGNDKVSVLHKYGSEALVGMINHAVEIANIVEEEKIDDGVKNSNSNPFPATKCPKCGSTNIIWIPEQEVNVGGLRQECGDCETTF